MPHACIALKGWHYHPGVLEALASIADVDVYVVSHKARSAVPESVYRYLPADRVFFEPDVGYDWGSYQQFIEKGLYRRYEYVFLMHDDLIIKDGGFVEASVRLLEGGASFVGNGRNDHRTNFPELIPWRYAHAAWKPPSPSFRHETMRGSFLATTAEALDRVGSFEVFWDWPHLANGFANWSLIATCARLQHMFGAGCFAFLSQTYLESPYLTELVRGGLVRASHRNALYAAASTASQKANAGFMKTYRALCHLYMKRYWAQDRAWCRVLEPLVRWPARRSWR